MKNMASQPIYQFYSELLDVQPKIWRRFQIVGNSSLARLGYVVMTLYEMKANHPFTIDYPVDTNLKLYADSDKVVPFPNRVERCYHYEVPSGESFPNDAQHKFGDATDVTVKRLSSDPGLLLIMMYDFGDGWEVRLTLEKVIVDSELPGKELPRVLDGEGFGIIEDCGGPDGLMHLSDVFKKKSGDEYDELSKWLGQEELDLSSFDLDDMNFRLKKVPRIFRDLYEYDYAPSERSIKILERAYLNK